MFITCVWLTCDVEREVDASARGSETETHGDEHRRWRRDAHQHSKNHRQGQRHQQGLMPAQPEQNTAQLNTRKTEITSTRDCCSPVRRVTQSQTAREGAQNEAHLLYWNQPVLRTHQIPLGTRGSQTTTDRKSVYMQCHASTINNLKRLPVGKKTLWSSKTAWRLKRKTKPGVSFTSWLWQKSNVKSELYWIKCLYYNCNHKLHLQLPY